MSSARPYGNALALPFLEMVYLSKLRPGITALWVLLASVVYLAFSPFFRDLSTAWLGDPEYSFGVLIPLMAAYLVWKRRHDLASAQVSPWPLAWLILLSGCGLQILGSISGALLLSGVALILAVMGIFGVMWGRPRSNILATPLGLLILMVPLPSYATGELSWHLQSLASTVSGALLSLIGVPVFQDGNLLRLPNYVLEVKQACSGSRSIFALLALAILLGFVGEKRWLPRILLVVAAPVFAVGANVVRIVGTGLIARTWGELAANDSLHEAWGVFAFLLALSGLVALQRILRWPAKEYA